MTDGLTSTRSPLVDRRRAGGLPMMTAGEGTDA